MFDIILETQPAPPVAQREVEFVERKGLGHPDSICDAVMEKASVALSQAYLATAGHVLHHNLDKCLLIAGQTTPKLGGGSVDEPMRLVVGDRATATWCGRSLPVGEIVQATVQDWFRSHMRYVRPEAHVVVQNELRPGAAELAGIFDPSRRPGCIVANDTSAAVGFAPLTETEQLVMAAEHFLNSPAFKHRFPDTGEDVKVMGARRGRRLQLTVAMAFVDHHVWDEATYFHRKEAARRELTDFLQTKLRWLDSVDVALNLLDEESRGLDGMYLTVLGTSAESGDGGEVGRGNRVNGLISFCRPMTLEAAAGKNCVSHVGKIYNLLARQLAESIHGTVPGVEQVYVWLCSQIGRPIDQPWCASVQLSLAPGASLGDVENPIRDLVRDGVGKIEEFTAELAAGRYSVC